MQDRISELPEDVLCSIIKRLTLRDAVKTSVLSHRWKSVYSCLSFLEFNRDNMFQELKNSESCKGCEDIYVGGVNQVIESCFSTSRLNRANVFQAFKNFVCCKGCEEKFVRGVNQFLNSYRGAKIDVFWVSFCLRSDFTEDIDQWVSLATRMGARVITINLCCVEYCDMFMTSDVMGIAQTEGRYVIRKEVFGDGKNNLKHLILSGCELGPNITNRFSSLEKLNLVNSDLSRYDMHGMFSSLVKLKYLMLLNAILPPNLCFGSLVLLKELVILSCSEIEEVQLSNNVNLSIFVCDCYPEVRYNLSGAPNLEILDCDSEELDYILTHLPSEAPRLRTLSFNVAADMEIPESIATFEQVTEIILILDSSPKYDILKMISILRAFPCLRKLFFVIFCYKESGQGELEHAEGMDERVDEIGDLFGTSNQIELENYLSEHAIVLQKIVLNTEENIYYVTRHSLKNRKVVPVLKLLVEFSERTVLIIE